LPPPKVQRYHSCSKIQHNANPKFLGQVGVENNHDDDVKGVVAEDYFSEQSKLKKPEKAKQTFPVNSGLGGKAQLHAALANFL